MYVKKINDVKEQLEQLKSKGIIEDWALPYENLLTRLSAAIFFVTPVREDQDVLSAIWDPLQEFEDFSFRINEEKKLSKLRYRVTFNSEEKEKNKHMQVAAI